MLFTSIFLSARDAVDGANGIRFSARKKGAFTSGTGSPFSGAFATSASESLIRIPKTDINPNKAVFTIDSKTSNILIVNNNACQLLGYRPTELCDMKFLSLLTNKTNKNYVSALAEGQLNSEDGTMVLLSGKVVEMNTKSGTKVAVSLWIRQIDVDGRCLAVAEPVERRVAQIMIDKNGAIEAADIETQMLFQIDTEDELIGTEIQNLIPAIQLPDADSSVISKSMRKQKATGKTRDNLSFPLCLMITVPDDSIADNADVSSTAAFVITVWVFQNVSGLIVIDENGSIELCNHHFSMLMFGYSQAKITRMHITRLIPNFGQEFEYLGNNRSRNITTSSLDDNEEDEEDNEESETETDPVYYEADQSFYATPTGLTASEYSKSSFSIRNANELFNKSANDREKSASEMPSFLQLTEQGGLQICPNMSKAISEPIQICLDMATAIENADESSNFVKNSSLEAAQSQQMNPANTNAVSKSMSENYLLPCEGDGKRQNGTNRRHTHYTNSCNSLKPSNGVSNLLHQHAANTKEGDGNCDGNELLTPTNDDQEPATVNETEISNKYLLSSDDSAVQNQAYRQSAITSLNSDCSHLFCTSDITEALDEIECDAPSEVSISKSANISKANQPTPATTAGQRFSEHASQQSLYHDGKYKGEAIHCDGNVIKVLYTISSQYLPCGRKVYCVWICRDECDIDEEDEDEGKHPNLTLTFNSITSNVETSNADGTTKRNSMNMSAAGGISAVGSSGIIKDTSSRPNSVSLLSQCEDEQVSGEYNKYYTTLKQIGKGAFGYVKMAFRHTDRLLVVTKFILKEKVNEKCFSSLDNFSINYFHSALAAAAIHGGDRGQKGDSDGGLFAINVEASEYRDRP